MSTPRNDLINTLPADTQSAIVDVEDAKNAWLAAREIERKATARVDTIKARRNESAENAEAQNKRWHELFRANDGEMTKEMRVLRSEVALDRESLEVFDELLAATEEEIETIPWDTADRASEYIAAHKQLKNLRAKQLWSEFMRQHGKELTQLLTLMNETLTHSLENHFDEKSALTNFVKDEILSRVFSNEELPHDPAFTLVGHYPQSASHYDIHKGGTPAARHKVSVRRAMKKQGGK